jgi:hypothetical protein
MAAIQITGFAPDVDPTTPGVWTACDGWIPTSKGMRSASVTRAAGGDYNSGTERWRFAQVGNVTLAVNKADLPQHSNTSGRFADMADMPKARYIATSAATAGDFVFLGATDDTAVTISGGPDSDDANRVWWSGIGNYTEWAPSLATQAAPS